MKNSKLMLKSGNFNFKKLKDPVINRDLNLNQWLEQRMTDTNVPYVDPCCTADSTVLPTSYNTATGNVNYYNNTTGLWTSLGSIGSASWGTPGVVVQTTSFTNPVTLNTKAGQIIAYAAGTIAAGTTVKFTLTNSYITTSSIILTSISDASGAADTENLVVNFRNPTAGTTDVLVQNIGSTAATARYAINYLILG